MKKLTDKQIKFCEEYLVDLNATQAAIRAGYSEKTADRIAYQNLRKLEIQEKIRELQIESRKKTEITKERILDELNCLLSSKITDYLSFNGSKITFKSFDKLTESQIKAIESIKETRHGIELKLHGKSWTIERVCKMLGFDGPTDIRMKIDELNEATADFILKGIFSNGKNQS